MNKEQKIKLTKNILAIVTTVIAFITLILDMSGWNAFQWMMYGWESGEVILLAISALLEVLFAIAAIVCVILSVIPKTNRGSFGLLAVIFSLVVAFLFFVQCCVTNGMGYYSNDIFFLPYIINLGSFIAYLIIYNKNKEKVPAGNFGKMYCTIGKFVLLSIVTFGIWPLIWIYRATNFLNEAPNYKKNGPGATLALCLFIPFYQIYWFYKQGKKADDLAQSIGLRVANIGKTCLIGAFFFTMIVPALIQGRINDVCVYSVENTL